MNHDGDVSMEPEDTGQASANLADRDQDNDTPTDSVADELAQAKAQLEATHREQAFNEATSNLNDEAATMLKTILKDVPTDELGAMTQTLLDFANTVNPPHRPMPTKVPVEHLKSGTGIGAESASMPRWGDIVKAPTNY